MHICTHTAHKTSMYVRINVLGPVLNAQLINSLVERVILCTFNSVGGVVHTAAVPSVSYKFMNITYVKS